MTRQSVLDELNERLKVYSIKILGNKKDKADGFYILMNTQPTYLNSKGVFHGIKKETLNLLDKAEIKYEILK
jgi:hypothetical protein